MWIGRRVARVVIWGVVLVLAILAGGIWFAYTYVTDGSNVARWIRQYAVRYLPGSQVDPGRVHVARLFGELTLHDIRLIQRIDGSPFEALWIPWLNIQVNTRKMLNGELDLREVDVVMPALRLCQRADGTWNLQGLLADPWPGPWLDRTPPIVIERGTIELVCPEEAPDSAVDERTARRGGGGPAAGGRGATILRDVSLRIDQVGGKVYRFQGSARGDILDHVKLAGTVDLATGRMTLEGELGGLTVAESLRQRLPQEFRPLFRDMALNGGVVDLDKVRIEYDPSAPTGSPLHYGVQARLRDGVWMCSKLPYPMSNLSAAFEVEDGVLTVHRAQCDNGATTLRAHGRMELGDPAQAPLDLHVELTDLLLDDRLRDWTPREQVELWDLLKPSGLVNARIDFARAVRGGAGELSAAVTCRDVAVNYRHFPYPIDHLHGEVDLKGERVSVDLETYSVGSRRLSLTGTIDHPGPDAVVKLDVSAESVPIDDTLRKALKPDVRKVVDQFHPSGTVKAHASVSRVPVRGKVEGDIAIDAEIDLSERCEITWVQLPYTIRNLTGRLELHPDRWIFRDMHGHNGQADITARGSVLKLKGPRLSNGEEPLKVHVELEARKLAFGPELRIALTKPYQDIWRTINPSGASDVRATVDADPYDGERTHIEIEPLPESSVRLMVYRTPQPKHLDPGGWVELRMDDVRGRFLFDNGRVSMKDVSVQFRGAPVRFESGTVLVEDTGRFELAVTDLWVKELRLDADLRKKMPPLMAQFAQKLDDGRTFTMRGDLQIGWSGNPREPAWCRWNKVRVVLNDNQLKTRIPLEHIQGELDRVSGWSNGSSVTVEGIMKLESVILLGQQITKAESPFRVENGAAELLDLRGRFLGGDLWGRGWVTLDPTPSYGATVTLHGARLEEYALTLGGRRSVRGNIEARIECSGLGGDLHTLQGQGDAHITDGDLGELPAYFRPVALVTRTLSRPDVSRMRIKTAFDSVDLEFKIEHGTWNLNPIKFTGNAFSLKGRGTLDPLTNLDLRLEPVLGRDRFHIPIISDLSREGSGTIVSARVRGTLADPDFKIELLPPLQRDPARAARRADRNSTAD